MVDGSKVLYFEQVSFVYCTAFRFRWLISDLVKIIKFFFRHSGELLKSPFGRYAVFAAIYIIINTFVLRSKQWHLWQLCPHSTCFFA
jgi:hypothetical protein